VFAAMFLALSGAAFAQGTQTEDECIAILKSDAGWQPKYEACTRLRQIGTEKSIPALASLLHDERLSHMARYALEPMPYPASTDALRKALGRAKGLQKTGIITSLGVKRDAKATKAIAKALKDKDADVARAAAGALGRIGTTPATLALLKAHKSAPETLQHEIAEGLLAATEQLVADGNVKSALPVFSTLLDGDAPQFIKLGALRGLAQAEPANAAALLVKQLGGSDATMRDFAAQVAAEVPGPEITTALAAALPSMPPAGQSALLRGLGDRKDASAHPAVVASLASGDAGVKQAATKALTTLGTSEDVGALAALLASDDAELANAAKLTLANMKAGGVDAAIVAALPNVAAAQRAILVDMLSERMANEAVPVAIASLNDADAGVRAAGLRTLTKLGTAAEAPVVIATLKGTADANERTDASNALNAICSQGGDTMLPIVLEGMKGAAPESRAVILRSLGRIGSAQALGSVVSALGDRNAEVSNEAVRVLGGWPTVEAAPHLLKLAQGSNAAHKDAALRGYVRLAGTEPDAAKKAAMLADALAVAKKPEEKWLVFPALGALGTKQSLDTLVPMLKDPAVKNEAATALISAATALAKADAASKPAAAEAVAAVLAACEDTAIRERAQKTLESLK